MHIRREYLYIAIALFIAAVSIVFTTSHKHKNKVVNSDNKNHLSRKLSELMPLPDHLEASCNLNNEKDLVICAQTSGKITRLKVKENDRVKPGQIVATIENKSLKGKPIIVKSSNCNIKESFIRSESAGTVKIEHAKAGDNISPGYPVITLKVDK